MSACSDHHLVKAGLKVKVTKTGVRMAGRSQFDIEKIEEGKIEDRGDSMHYQM